MERGLGRDAAHQRQHVGDVAASCFDAEVYSLLLELNQEGPRREEDMFTAVGGVLLFTDFSRACELQWVRKHGRRFACYKQRKDTGSKAPKRGGKSAQTHRPHGQSGASSCSRCLCSSPRARHRRHGRRCFDRRASHRDESADRLGRESPYVGGIVGEAACPRGWQEDIALPG